MKPPVSQKPAEQKSDSKQDALISSGKLASMEVLKASQRRGKSRGGARRAPSLPPILDAVMSCTHTFRFQVTTGFGSLVNITGGNLAGAIGGYCTIANSTVKTIASSIRVRGITVWPSQQSSPQNPPEIVWFSPITVMEKDASKERMLPAGVSVTAPLSTRPPPNTLCSDWFAVSSGSSQPMFGLINMAAGNVIDVRLSFTVTNNLLGSTQVVTTGTLGTYYYLYLDGSTSHQIQPVGKPTTF